MSAGRQTNTRRQGRDRRTSDRRDSDRIPLEDGIRFLRSSDTSTQVLRGELLDVSATGLRIVLDERLPIAEKLLVEVRGDKQRCFNMTAAVVRIDPLPDGRFEVGCELCIDLSDRQIRTLARFAETRSAAV